MRPSFAGFLKRTALTFGVQFLSLSSLLNLFQSGSHLTPRPPSTLLLPGHAHLLTMGYNGQFSVIVQNSFPLPACTSLTSSQGTTGAHTPPKTVDLIALIFACSSSSFSSIKFWCLRVWAFLLCSFLCHAPFKTSPRLTLKNIPTPMAHRFYLQLRPLFRSWTCTFSFGGLSTMFPQTSAQRVHS